MAMAILIVAAIASLFANEWVNVRYGAAVAIPCILAEIVAICVAYWAIAIR